MVIKNIKKLQILLLLKLITYLFGGGDMEMDGENVFTDAKNAYNKNVKDTKLGKALKKSVVNAIGDVYDVGENKLGTHKYTKPISKVTNYPGLV
jgi:hypothetical protein